MVTFQERRIQKMNRTILALWLSTVALVAGPYPGGGPYPFMLYSGGAPTTTSYNTNIAYISGSSSNACNTAYYWNSGLNRYTNINGIALMLDPTGSPDFTGAATNAFFWELTNGAQGIIFDTSVSGVENRLFQYKGGWENTLVGTEVSELGMSSSFATNTTTAFGDPLLFFDNGINLTNADKFKMPLATSNGLVAKWWGRTNMMFVDAVVGNDSTAVLGDPTHPALTLTNAQAKIPTNGAVWLTANQVHYVFGTHASPSASDSAGIHWTNGMVLIAMGAYVVDNAFYSIQITNAGNCEIWGGTFDFLSDSAATISGFNWAVPAAQVGAGGLFLHYCKIIGWQDCVGINIPPNARVYIENCDCYSEYDILNMGSSATNLTYTASSCRFLCSPITPDGYNMQYGPNTVPLPRNINQLSAGYFRWTDCDFITVYPRTNVTATCYIAGGGTNYFNNCRFVVGGATNTATFTVTASNAPTVVNFIGQAPNSPPVVADALATVTYGAPVDAYNGWFNGNGNQLTNLLLRITTNAIPNTGIMVDGNSYFTNLQAAITLGNFNVPANLEWDIHLWCSNNSGANRVVTFPNGTAGNYDGVSLGHPAAYTVTNGQQVTFDIKGYGYQFSNVIVFPMF